MGRTVPLMAATFFIWACTGASTSEIISQPEEVTLDTAGTVDAGQDHNAPDMAEIAVPTDLPGDFHDFKAADVPENLCEEGAGCFLDFCQENSQCQAGWCVEHMGEKVCTQTCQEECPQGWTCSQLGGGPDVTYICVSNYPNLCRPCSEADDCAGVAGTEDACVSYENEGSFCGGKCGEDGKCPWGFECKTVLTVDGVELEQCVAGAGSCPCTPTSVALGLFTPCETSNDFGVCAGKRVCTDGGLGDCDALVPGDEVCNGVDDNCDGDVDEPTLVEGDFVNPCDDANPCTEDKCEGEGGCVNEVLNSGACEDGDPCTVADHCEEGTCIGDPVICDDANPCTDNICTELGGCDFPSNTSSCDDGDACTLADQCDDGICAGTQVACDCQEDADCAQLEDGDLCNGTLSCDTSALPFHCAVDEDTVVDCPAPQGQGAICLMASCEPETGSCGFEPTNEGLLCNGSNDCLVNFACEMGQCAGGTPVNCNDGNECTDDSCDPESGCIYADNMAPCNDGDVCTTGDTCGVGECAGGSALDCDDGNLCNGTESCDSDLGCVPGEPQNCDDGDMCNGTEVCDPLLGCQPGAGLPCDDGNICTDDSCNPKSGCVHTLNQAPCNDGDVCTQSDSCANGVCTPGPALLCDDQNVCNGVETCDQGKGCVAGQPLPCDDLDACNGAESCDPLQGCQMGVALDCNDGNPCTEDSCAPVSGCVHELLDAVPCDDGNQCTDGDLCETGVCIAGVAKECADDDPCTDNFCDPQQGCVSTLNAAPCDDDDLCTTGDFCHLGECTGAGELPCDDGNSCTDDSCDPQAGCQFLANFDDCDDGSKCTVGDKCSNGWCLPGPALPCNDDDTCTDDLCLPGDGCVFVNNAAPCDDTDICTTKDACVNGQCTGGPALDCNDNNPCTDESCEPGEGCQYAFNSAACEDGNECTTEDTCVEGACTPGSGVLECLDGNPCTDDACNPDVGCIFVNNVLACDDDDECTDGDACANGECASGPPLECPDDGNTCTTHSCDSQNGCETTVLPDCCGNGIKEAGEECDDGNQSGNDQCSSDCQNAAGSCFADWKVGTPCNGTDYGGGCTPAETGFHWKGMYNGYACWWNTKNQAWMTTATNPYQLAQFFGLNINTGQVTWCHSFSGNPSPPLGGCGSYCDINEDHMWGWCGGAPFTSGGWMCFDAAGKQPCN